MNTPRLRRARQGPALRLFDPMRDALLVRAEHDFARERWADFRTWVDDQLAHWGTSPTACFLVAMSYAYESASSGDPSGLPLARDLLGRAERRWRTLLDERDLREVDATHVFTAIAFLGAFIDEHLGRADALRGVVERVGVARGAPAWHRQRHPALVLRALADLELLERASEGSGRFHDTCATLLDEARHAGSDLAQRETPSGPDEFALFRHSRHRPRDDLAALARAVAEPGPLRTLGREDTGQT
ncbi:MAG: hypothetical protein H6825_08735 [Planctomycetes bacterium]|nr:hypothetical protein [Planctomycetota bacterium]